MGETFEGMPVLTGEQMRELDRRATEEFSIPPETLMENAGSAVAHEILAILPTFPRPGEGRMAGLPGQGGQVRDASGKKEIIVFCGRGNNGGDGLVIARVLKQKGIEVKVLLAAPKKDRSYGELVAKNLARAEEAGVQVVVVEENETFGPDLFSGAILLVDALLGTGSAGKPEGSIEKMIIAMNESCLPIIAVDIPSGLNPDTGLARGAAVKASFTYTLGAAKPGLLKDSAIERVGKLKVLDIGYPSDLMRKYSGDISKNEVS